MDATFALQTGRMAVGTAVKHSPYLGKDPLFGLIPKFLAWNIIIVLIVVLIFYWLTKNSRKSGETALDILSKRYAIGDIDRKTYFQMKKDLSE